MTEHIKLEYDFKKFETKFHNIDRHLQILTDSKNKELQNVISLIDRTILNSKEIIQNVINDQRENLIEDVKSEFSKALITYEIKKKFEPTQDDRLKRLKIFLLGKLSYAQEMKLLKKTKYSNLCELFLEIGDASLLKGQDNFVLKVHDVIL